MIEFRPTQIEAWFNGVRIGHAQQTAPEAIRVMGITGKYRPEVKTMAEAEQIITDEWGAWLEQAGLEKKQ